MPRKETSPITDKENTVERALVRHRENRIVAEVKGAVRVKGGIPRGSSSARHRVSEILAGLLRGLVALVTTPGAACAGNLPPSQLQPIGRAGLPPINFQREGPIICGSKGGLT
jgi:hypothetical protein